MARFEFKLPDIGEGIAEAEIVAWHVKIGDEIAEDQQIADMMTDKPTVEMESPVAGKVIELAGEVGDQVPIGSVLAVIETEQHSDAGGIASSDGSEYHPANVLPVLVGGVGAVAVPPEATTCGVMAEPPLLSKLTVYVIPPHFAYRMRLSLIGVAKLKAVVSPASVYQPANEKPGFVGAVGITAVAP